MTTFDGEDAGDAQAVIDSLLDRWEGRRVTVQLWGLASPHAMPAVAAYMEGKLGLLTERGADNATFAVGENARFSISREMAWARWKDVQAHTRERVLYVAQDGVMLVIGRATAS